MLFLMYLIHLWLFYSRHREFTIENKNVKERKSVIIILCLTNNQFVNGVTHNGNNLNSLFFFLL